MKEKIMCVTLKHSSEGKILQTCKLIISEETPNSHKEIIKSLDQRAQDLKDNTKIIGRVTLVPDSEFRETIPVVTRVTGTNRSNACLKKNLITGFTFRN